MNRASLLVVQGVDLGARFELTDRLAAMGRDVKNRVRILDTEVSRFHATIHFENSTFVLVDQNSSNGTFVNGALVKSHPLMDGDQIQLGHTLLQFVITSRQGLSPSAAEKVLISQQHDPADRSNIVSQRDGRVASAPISGVPLAGANSPSNLTVLYRITEEVVRPTVSMEQSLQRILELTIEAVGADRGSVLLTDVQSGDIRPQVACQRGVSELGARMPVSRAIVNYVLQNNQGVRTTDAQHDRRFDPTYSIVQAGVREAMCVPMQGRHELMGVIYVDITTPANRLPSQGETSGFREDQLELLLAIGRQAALAVENHRYQLAFVKAERMGAMGQTIATLSHHSKNILQGVRGGSYLIDMGLTDHNEDLVRKGWHVVEKNQNKIYHLVMDMLTFSKERQPVSVMSQLNDVIGEVVELMHARATECSVELQFHPDPNLPECSFDPEGIHRAVLNIVTNAIDAVEGVDHASVKIISGLQVESDMVWVSITDNGRGIPEEQIGGIFNVFESTKGARGTGLGLAVSLKIIREHGGDITVVSRLGEGARFTLAWPRLENDNPLDRVTEA